MKKLALGDAFPILHDAARVRRGGGRPAATQRCELDPILGRRYAARRFEPAWRSVLGAPGSFATALLLALAATASTPATAGAQPDGSFPVRKILLQVAGSLNEALEHAPSYQPIPWTDPSGSSTGTITVFSPIQQGGRPCRSFKYVLRDMSEQVTGTGMHCRGRGGLWLAAGVPDSVVVRPVVRSAGPIPLAPPAAIPQPAQPDPLLAQLQANLARLAYDPGPADGRARPGFQDALRLFEADEGVASTPEPIGRDLTLSAAAVARSELAGSCEPPADVQASALVCGRRR